MTLEELKTWAEILADNPDAPLKPVADTILGLLADHAKLQEEAAARVTVEPDIPPRPIEADPWGTFTLMPRKWTIRARLLNPRLLGRPDRPEWMACVTESLHTATGRTEAEVLHALEPLLGTRSPR